MTGSQDHDEPDPFFRAKDERRARVQAGTVKFFEKALSKFAGMKDTALNLHHKATAWYKRFPRIRGGIAARIAQKTRTPRCPGPTQWQVDGGDGAGGSPEDEEDVEDRPVASESSSDEADDAGRQ